MAKIKHNKYQNSAILYELLVRQLTSDIMVGKDSPAVNIIKSYFTNSELSKEHKLYNIIVSNKTLSESKANMLIETTINVHKKLNKSLLRRQRYNLIKEIKNNYDLENFFKAKINNYKAYAALCSLFELAGSSNFVEPDLIVKNKVVLLEHLTKQPSNEETKDKILEEYMSSDKGTRFLTYKILIEKFNKKYSNLDEDQKDILREYINNVSNTNNLKEYINTKFTSIKKELKSLVKNVEDKTTLIKLVEVYNIIKPLEKSDNVKDDDVLNLLQYSQLVTELKSLK